MNPCTCQLPWCWKLALRREMEVHCVGPARGSLIKLSPGSWNVISSFVIQARTICLHFTFDGLRDNNGLGSDDAEAILMEEGSQGSQTATRNPSDPSHLEIEYHWDFFFPIDLPFRVFPPRLHHLACGWCNMYCLKSLLSIVHFPPLLLHSYILKLNSFL